MNATDRQTDRRTAPGDVTKLRIRSIDRAARALTVPTHPKALPTTAAAAAALSRRRSKRRTTSDDKHRKLLAEWCCDCCVADVYRWATRWLWFAWREVARPGGGFANNRSDKSVNITSVPFLKHADDLFLSRTQKRENLCNRKLHKRFQCSSQIRSPFQWENPKFDPSYFPNPLICLLYTSDAADE